MYVQSPRAQALVTLVLSQRLQQVVLKHCDVKCKERPFDMTQRTRVPAGEMDLYVASPCQTFSQAGLGQARYSGSLRL